MIHALFLFQKYLGCLKESKDMHYKCRELSREYLQCRMDNQLMHQENLDNVSRRLTVGVLYYYCVEEYHSILLCHLIKYISNIYPTILLTFYQLGYSEDKEVKGAKENDRAKEKAGFIAGKHIHKKGEWWFQQIGRQKKWVEESSDSNNNKEGGDKPDPS